MSGSGREVLIEKAINEKYAFYVGRIIGEGEKSGLRWEAKSHVKSPVAHLNTSVFLALELSMT